ncbi:hypothetical protein QQP08_006910 [Theobroma cacao]|nr:hypothetical protein QQP08_006910 [Theobroma cacao]
MANFVLQLPTSNLRSFSVYASSNGAPMGTGSQSGGPVILELPLDKIRRPLMRTRANDPNKVQELMDSIREIGLQVPVSPVVIVMRLTSALGSQKSVAKFDASSSLSGSICFLKCIHNFDDVNQTVYALLSFLQVQYILNLFYSCSGKLDYPLNGWKLFEHSAPRLSWEP